MRSGSVRAWPRPESPPPHVQRECRKTQQCGHPEGEWKDAAGVERPALRDVNVHGGTYGERFRDGRRASIR
jgi:hypothetical protein